MATLMMVVDVADHSSLSEVHSDSTVHRHRASIDVLQVESSDDAAASAFIGNSAAISKEKIDHLLDDYDSDTSVSSIMSRKALYKRSLETINLSSDSDMNMPLRVSSSSRHSMSKINEHDDEDEVSLNQKSSSRRSLSSPPPETRDFSYKKIEKRKVAVGHHHHGQNEKKTNHRSSSLTKSSLMSSSNSRSKSLSPAPVRKSLLRRSLRKRNGSSLSSTKTSSSSRRSSSTRRRSTASRSGKLSSLRHTMKKSVLSPLQEEELE